MLMSCKMVWSYRGTNGDKLYLHRISHKKLNVYKILGPAHKGKGKGWVREVVRPKKPVPF